MRILFLDFDTRIPNVVFSVYFACDALPDGSYDVYFIDSEGDYWHCNSMSRDDFDEYSYWLAVKGYIDLRAFSFRLDAEDAKD